MTSYIKKIFVIVLLVVTLACLYLKKQIYSDGPLEYSAYVLINKGNGSSVVASKLKNAGVISNALIFKIAARALNLDKKLKAGEYSFSPRISMFEALKKLARGEIIYRKITLPEGLTTKQILQIIKNEPMLDGDISIEVNEGDLLPETYSFVRGDTKDNIIKQAKRAMEEALREAWKNKDSSLPVKNTKELLILASIIEKETSVDDERTLVASVFVNRLRKGMKLQTDPTVIYAITKGKKDLERLLNRKDLKIDSPYNTYKYYGLPPAPICNPGKASISAAANPEISNYLYFVADGNGGHNFAKSLQEHNNNVNRWKKLKK